MNPKDYQAIMQEMLRYASETGTSISFENHTQLYYKLKAMYDFARKLYTEGKNNFTFINQKNEYITYSMQTFCQGLEKMVKDAEDKDFKLEPLHAYTLNQFVKSTGFKYEAPSDVNVSDATMDDLLKSMQYLAGIAPHRYTK